MAFSNAILIFFVLYRQSYKFQFKRYLNKINDNHYFYTDILKPNI